MLNSGRPEFRCNPSLRKKLYAKMIDPRVIGALTPVPAGYARG
jgi:hypothetical protein